MKTVLITGASGGLGSQLTRHFASKGWQVAATMLRVENYPELAVLPNVRCYEMDVCSVASIENAKAAILKDFGFIDTVINNAGMGYRSFVELAEDDKLAQLIDVNWMGVVRICRAFIPVFKQQRVGQFINISSIAGLVNLPMGSFYHPSKHAVESFSECMAYELDGTGISICTVQFGNILTDFQKNLQVPPPTKIKAYNVLRSTIAKYVGRRGRQNKKLKAKICQKVFAIANKPPKHFRRYTIGFDAVFLKVLHRLLGYRLFAAIVRQRILR